jgi:hypothetical protein
MGEKTKSLSGLRKAMELGYSNSDWISRDTDLTCLHGDPAFEAILQEMRAKT